MDLQRKNDVLNLLGILKNINLWSFHFWIKAINIYYSLIEEYKGLPFNIKLPEGDSSNENINPEVINYLKESIKKNYHIGELLAKWKNIYLLTR